MFMLSFNQMPPNIFSTHGTTEILQTPFLMTLDTIMKCVFSHQGSAQLDSSVTKRQKVNSFTRSYFIHEHAVPPLLFQHLQIPPGGKI